MNKTTKLDKSLLLGLVALALGLGSLLYSITSLQSIQKQLALLEPAQFSNRIQGEIDLHLARQEQLKQEEQSKLHHVQMNQEFAREQEKAKAVPEVQPGEALYGNPQAELTIYEYGNLVCVGCKEFFFAAKNLVDQSQGKVNWVFRHLPLPSQDSKEAFSEAAAAECVLRTTGQTAFWDYAQKLYTAQGTDLANLSPELLQSLALEVGVKKESWSSCLKGLNPEKAFAGSLQSFRKLGIGALPGLILVHHPSKRVSLASGTSDLVELQAQVALLLELPEAADPQSLAQGEQLYQKNCASCHGKQGDGQNPQYRSGGQNAQGEWMAPALNGKAHAWHHPTSSLFAKIKQGSQDPQSPMKGFQGKLKDQEIWSILAYLQNQWSPEQKRPAFAKK